MWGVMRKFNVLPTDPRFRELTKEQLEFIFFNIERDNKEAERAAKGLSLEAEFEDYNAEEWWNAEHDDFTALNPDHDEEAIFNQVEAMTTKEDMDRLKDRWSANKELADMEAEGLISFQEETVNEYINNNLKKLFAEAKDYEASGINKWGEKSDIQIEEEKKEQDFSKITAEGVTHAIDVFNGIEEAEPEFPTQDDDFEI